MLSRCLELEHYICCHGLFSLRVVLLIITLRIPLLKGPKGYKMRLYFESRLSRLSYARGLVDCRCSK